MKRFVFFILLTAFSQFLAIQRSWACGAKLLKTTEPAVTSDFPPNKALEGPTENKSESESDSAKSLTPSSQPNDKNFEPATPFQTLTQFLLRHQLASFKEFVSNQPDSKRLELLSERDELGLSLYAWISGRTNLGMTEIEQVEMMRFLIEQGLPLNPPANQDEVKSDIFQDPLYWAVITQKMKIVEFLLQNDSQIHYIHLSRSIEGANTEITRRLVIDYLMQWNLELSKFETVYDKKIKQTLINERIETLIHERDLLLWGCKIKRNKAARTLIAEYFQRALDGVKNHESH